MTETMEVIRAHAAALPPLAKFAVIMAIIVGIPPLFRRIRLPDVGGFLLSGVLIGPYVIGLDGQHRPTVEFAAELGKLLLMFFCGLEINLTLFRQVQRRAITFGLITTLTPLLLGTAVGFWFGYEPIGAIVLGSLLASHTLLAAPIVSRLGVTRAHHHYNRRDRSFGHAIPDRVRNLCFDLQERLFGTRACCTAY